jgi:UDP-N-acetylmuramate dehydrogenase
MTRSAQRALVELLGDGVGFDVPMARHTSLRVGGPADALASPADRGELQALLALCAQHALPHRMLGGGFNTLVLDGGVDGVVVSLRRFRRLEERPGGELLAEAGVSHSQITRLCQQRGFTGLEFGAGIPGTLGGWIAMNAGIPGREIEAAVREIEVVSPTGAQRSWIPRNRLCFRYRGLRGLANGSAVVSARLAIAISTPTSVKREVEQLLARRSATQPLDLPSCGSVFRNPRGDHAGRLIESAGLKGLRIGGAEISPLHANFITNVGGARAADVLALIETARREVHRSSGVWLEPEVHIVGRSS